MKRPIWFKAKKYGWGWNPSTWQGWLILFLFVVLVIALSVMIERVALTPEEGFWLSFMHLTPLVIVLILVCAYTGERPRWRWGGKDIRRKK
ncbi:MAG: hypothetical protein ABL890_00255 [Candidatus Peribacteraceae bacterium]